MWLTITPFPFVSVPIRNNQDTSIVWPTVAPFRFLFYSIGIGDDPLPMPLSIYKWSFKFFAIFTQLDSLTVMFTFNPFTFLLYWKDKVFSRTQHAFAEGPDCLLSDLVVFPSVYLIIKELLKIFEGQDLEKVIPIWPKNYFKIVPNNTTHIEKV